MAVESKNQDKKQTKNELSLKYFEWFVADYQSTITEWGFIIRPVFQNVVQRLFCKSKQAAILRVLIFCVCGGGNSSSDTRGELAATVYFI